eukprot:TRINITY_DN714_c0_g1_i1.p1 TRINITY_DN714_c0_g1~~TRINITY_DN714_c0_g1_i1.p1  ORF type:complete len:619 (+),score=218.63 TRINITY_DN714_c0_g1_i1:263-2119(+)
MATTLDSTQSVEEMNVKQLKEATQKGKKDAFQFSLAPSGSPRPRHRPGKNVLKRTYSLAASEMEGANVQNDQRLWYQEAVFYEVYVRAFCDGNGDGHGDLQGLTSRLDYLSNLGVNCVWLLPIYPSPLKDDGYDVADYCNVHPHYGNMDDFRTLVNAVHERNMRIIADLIPNHTSDQHDWFQKSRIDKEGKTKYHDYYVWTDNPNDYKDARIIFTDTEKSNWSWDEVRGQYYWHRFFSSQPDLNFDNPLVQEEMLDVMRFWLKMGIDGFRVDAIPYLFEREGTNCENLPETHEYLKRMRTMMDNEFPGKIMLAEACQLPHQVREYFGDGDEFHMGFHFPIMPRIYMSIRAHDSTSLKDILAQTPDIPEGCQWVTFLRNHDELTLEMVTPEERQWMWKEYAPDMQMRINMGIRRRLHPLMDNDRRRVELAKSMLLTLPGSPILYYGDEIGTGDNIQLFDRNGVRTPMQWDNTRPHAGFSQAENLYAPVIDSPLYNCDRVNVRDAQADPSSLYNVLRHMIAQRRKHQAFGSGKLFWLDHSDKSIAAWLRIYKMDIMLVVCNMSDESRNPTIDLPDKYVTIPDVEDVLTETQYSIEDNKINVPLDPYAFKWIELSQVGCGF